MQVSAHICPPVLHRDLQRVFPQVDPSRLLVVPTFQPTQHDMVSIGAGVDEEKDDKLDKVRDNRPRHLSIPSTLWLIPPTPPQPCQPLETCANERAPVHGVGRGRGAAAGRERLLVRLHGPGVRLSCS